MKARFLDGPYAGVRLHVDKKATTLVLEVEVHIPNRLNLEGVAPTHCHAHYILEAGNEFEGWFRFLGLRPS